jgi:hypothetical protein
VSYGLENAIFQWEEAERRLRELDPSERARTESGVGRALDELRRRLGSEFSVQELSDLYASEPELAAGVPAWVVDAAFARYAREASDYGGGRRRQSYSRARD